MSEQIERTVVASELSVLAYLREVAAEAALLDPGTSLPADRFRTALLTDLAPGRDISVRSALDLAERYEVVAGVGSSDETNGFQAVLVRRIPVQDQVSAVDGTPLSALGAIGDGESEYVLAIAGTEFGVDNVNDLFNADILGIGLVGVASNQIPPLADFLEEVVAIVGDDEVEIVGHSLGGHLAMLAGTAISSITSRVSTINSAGISFSRIIAPLPPAGLLLPNVPLALRDLWSRFSETSLIDATPFGAIPRTVSG